MTRIRTLGAPVLLIAAAAGCSSSDARGPEGDNPPAVGTFELFAELPSSTEGIALGKDAAGNDVLFAGGGGKIYQIAADRSVTTFAAVPDPLGLAWHPDGYLVVCGHGGAGSSSGPDGAVWRVSTDGTVSLLAGPDKAPLQEPNFVVVDADGSMIVSDSDANVVFRVSPDRATVATLTDAISYPNGMAFSPDGSGLYVASWDSKRVVRMDRAGAGFGAPNVAVDGVENVDGVVSLVGGDLVLVTSGSGVLRVTPGGAPSTLAPADKLALPANGVMSSGSFEAGWLYVTNLLAKRIDRVFVGEAGAAP